MTLYKLEGKEYIELNKLLKLLTLVSSGGEAKMRIKEGEANVNGETEWQVRKKLRAGDKLTFDGVEITVEL